MRNDSAIRIIILTALFSSFSLLSIEIEAQTTHKIISKGVHRYIGYLELKDNEYFLILNKETSTPYQVRIDVGDKSGLASFSGNVVDLELKFDKSCVTGVLCRARLSKYHGIHGAFRRVPVYLFGG
jgi:hypothetical protein